MTATNQGHGHVTPRQDGYKSRCGGPAMCSVCKAEQSLLRAPQEPTEAARTFLAVWARTNFGNGHFDDYIKNDLAGDFAFNLAAVLHRDMKPAVPADPTHEQSLAIREGHEIAKSDAYFKARHPMLDTTHNRSIFRAGFDRGWDAAAEEKGGA